MRFTRPVPFPDKQRKEGEEKQQHLYICSVQNLETVGTSFSLWPWSAYSCSEEPPAGQTSGQTCSSISTHTSTLDPSASDTPKGRSPRVYRQCSAVPSESIPPLRIPLTSGPSASQFLFSNLCITEDWNRLAISIPTTLECSC